MKKLITILILSNLFFNYVFAQQSCDRVKDGYDRAYCFSAIYNQSDLQLNSSHQELNSLLTKAKRKTLNKMQLNWVEKRNSTCSLAVDKKFLSIWNALLRTLMLKEIF